MAVLEILGVERRRRWSDTAKASILAEVGVDGCTVPDVAGRHDVTRQHLYQWRRELRQKGMWPGHGVDAFAAVELVPQIAEEALTAFEAGPWGQKYPAIGQSWRRAWEHVIPFFAFPGDVRRIIYTTNAIEALNSKLRRAVRARGHFPSDEAASKLLYLILHRSEKEWVMPARQWAMAKAQFAVLFGDRFVRVMAA